MMTFEPTKWEGLDTISQEEFDALRAPVEQGLLAAALHFSSAVKKKLAGKRSGRVYVLYLKSGKRYHQASAPGEPPARLNGKLAQSITWGDVSWVGDSASIEVGTAMEYARILEMGGIAGNGARILPRPYFASAWLEELPRIEAILDKVVELHPQFSFDRSGDVPEQAPAEAKSKRNRGET